MATLDELLVGLGFEYDPKELETFKKDIDASVGAIKALVKIAVAASVAITGMAVASTAASDEQGKLAKSVGQTVEEIDALQFANKRAGGSADGMANSLKQLSIRASEAARGTGSAVEAFGILGISSTNARGKLKSTSNLMLEVSQRFKGLGEAQQIELADKLGLSDSILLLQEGPDAIKALVNEARALGVTTGEDAALAADFQDSLVDLWQITKQFSRLLSRIFVPAMQSINDLITEWWKANKDIIQQNLPVWIEKLTFALKLMTLAVAAFLALKFFALMGALPTLLAVATAGALKFAAAIFTVPAVIGLIVAAVALLAEDANKFFNGQASFIGDMITKYPQWGDKIKFLAGIFNTIAETTKTIFDGWSQIINLFDNFSTNGFKEVLKNIPGFLGDITGISPIGNEPDVLGGVTGTSYIGNDAGAVSNSNSVTRSTSVDTVTISVNGAGDPTAVGRAVANQFERALQDTSSAVDQ